MKELTVLSPVGTIIKKPDKSNINSTFGTFGNLFVNIAGAM
jgi:hypothetical protein